MDERVVRRSWLVGIAVIVMALGAGVTVAQLDAASQHTVPLNLDAEVRQGFDRFYVMDFDGAYRIFTHVQQAHVNDPMAYNYLLFTVIFRELYHQDLLDTTYYAHNSFLSTKREIQVPAATRQQVEDLTNKVIDMTDVALKANPNDKNALFERGYAKGMHGAFVVLVDHAFAMGARQGYAARNDSEQVIKLDAQYGDAYMAVGIQQFAVASLPGVVRMLIGIMGVGGNRQKGLEMLHFAAAHGVVTSVESRTALSLFLRHDGRYSEALAVQQQLAKDYPHDYLFRLEVANLTKDEGHGLEAVAAYKSVIEDAQRPGYFTDARLQMAYFGMADTQRGYNLIKDAAANYTLAAQQPNSSDWLRKRAWLNAGEMEDVQGNRKQAIADYQQVLKPGGDQTQAQTAREHLQKPFQGK
jgi:tetratricopeptide (TPR) repeat protein